LVRHEQEWHDWLGPGKETASPVEGFLLRARPPRPWVPVALYQLRLQGEEEARVLIGLRDRREMLDARRRAQRAEAELRLVLACGWDGLGSCGVERRPAEEGGWHWRYRYPSPAAERLTGRPLGHLLEAPGNWRAAVAPDDRPAWQAFRARLAEGRGGELEYRLVRPDGAVVPVREQATVAPAENGWSVFGAVAALPAPQPSGGGPAALERALEGRCEAQATMAGGL